MSKPFKILLWIVGGFFLLIATVVLAVTLLFDPNDYKDEIAIAAKEATGRDLVIRGDIELHVFPWLALSLGETALSNAPGFGEKPMLEFKQVEASLRLLPLVLHRMVEIGTVRAEGLSVRLAKNQDGLTNWADLIRTAEDAPAPQPTPPPDGPAFDLAQLNVGGVEIKDASLIFSDAQAGVEYRVENLKIETGALKAGEPVDLLVACLLSATKPELVAELKFSGSALANLDTRVYELRKLALDLTARGAPVPGGKQDLSLRGEASYDQAQGTFAFAKGELEAAGLKLHTELAGQDLNGAEPRYTGTLRSETFNPRELAAGLGVRLPATTDPAVLSAASFAAQLDGGAKRAALNDLVLKLDQTNASGRVLIKDYATQALEFALKVDAFDADRYMPVGAAAEPEQPAPKGDVNAIRLPVEALDKINAAGTFEMGLLKARNLKFTDVVLKVTAAKGMVKTQSLNAKFYGGTIVQSARLIPAEPPQYELRAEMAAIDSGPLVQDFMGKDLLAGVGDVKLSTTSAGYKVGELRRALDGELAFSFQNGAVKGVNLGETLRKGKALVRGESYAAPAAAPQTDFAELRGSGQIVDGVLKTNDLTAKSPMLRFEGAGSIDLAAEQIDYLARPTVVDTSKGQGGAELAELKGIPVPIRIRGSLTAPAVKIDWDAVFKNKAKAQLKEEEKEVKEKLKKKLEKKLGDFFK